MKKLYKCSDRRALGLCLFGFLSFSVAIAASPLSSPAQKGTITLPSTNTTVKVGGTIKALANFDTGASTGDCLESFNIPLKGVNAGAQKGGNFGGSLRWSKLNLESITPTAHGDLRAYVEFDFAAGSSINTTGTSYGPRLRYAYVECCHWLVGQNNTLFEDLQAMGTNIDPNGIVGNGFNRQVQVRFTQKFNMGSFAVSAEYPVTDYTDQTGALQKTNNGYGVSIAPDLAMQLKFMGHLGHIALRAMTRQIAVKYVVESGMATTYPNYKKSVTGWGLGVSGKLITVGKSGLFAQINGGDGIGRYIPCINGQAAFFDLTRGILKTQRALNTFGGYEHYWADAVRTNIMASYTCIHPSAFSPKTLTSTTRITKRLRTYFANVIYSPLPQLEVGLEFARLERYTLDRKKGDENRIIFGLNYTF